jgi:Fe-S-cluster-containing dehydrogenase component
MHNNIFNNDNNNINKCILCIHRADAGPGLSVAKAAAKEARPLDCLLRLEIECCRKYEYAANPIDEQKYTFGVKNILFL